MYIYLSKKIAVRSNTKITCISWNKSDGYIAVGGEQGLLKVLKLESGSTVESSNLTLNQPLEKHTEDLKVVAWNPVRKKLTTSDESGVIVVWILYKGNWHEEMVNNRKKSTVVDMAWSNDGTMICIVYADGAVIVGAVGGNRIWAKDLRDTALSKVQWSPNGKLLLFGLQSGEVKLYDNMGNYIMPVRSQYLYYSEDQLDNTIASLCWYKKDVCINYRTRATIIIAYENGLIHLMAGIDDQNAIILNTKLLIMNCCWDHNGHLFAVVGKDLDSNSNGAHVFNCFGELLRTLRLPGENVTCCAWEKGSLRLAIGIDSAIYFANIHPDYKWTYFKNTVVFESNQTDEFGVCVTFWNTQNHFWRTRYLPIVSAIASCDNYCVLATVNENTGQHTLLVCNSLGNLIDSRNLDVEVRYLTMNNYFVVAASSYVFYTWTYRTVKTKLIKNRDIPWRLYHIEDTTFGAIDITDNPTFRFEAKDPICTLTLSEFGLCIGKISGVLWHFTFPNMAQVKMYTFDARSYKTAINCNSTRLAVIDVTGTLTVVDLCSHRTIPVDDRNRLERKDVWSMCWAKDNPELLAIMEKARMYVFKGVDPEEPISCSGYICSFKDLEIRAVYLDVVIEKAIRPLPDHVIKIEIKSLRDTNQLLDKVGMKEATLFIEDNPHPRLWYMVSFRDDVSNLLGETALKQLDYSVALQAFVKAKDYSGIELINCLDEYSNDFLRKAHVAACFKQFDEAEKLFIEADRSDLAIEMRVNIGDSFRAIQMAMNGVYASDEVMRTAYLSCGDYFAQKRDWVTALEYYELTKNKNKLVKANAQLKNYKMLEKMVDQLKEGDPILKAIGYVFCGGGYPVTAINAFSKLGDVKLAALVCINNHMWDEAVKIGHEYDLEEVTDAFWRFTDWLIEAKGRYKDAVVINMKAKYFFTAGKILRKFADKLMGYEGLNLILVKRMYVYAGWCIDRYKTASTKCIQMFFHLNPINMTLNAKCEGTSGISLYCRRKIASDIQRFQRLDLSTHSNIGRDVWNARSLFSRFRKNFDFEHSNYQLGYAECLWLGCAIAEIPEAKKEKYRKMALKIFRYKSPINLVDIRNYTPCHQCQAPVCDWLNECPYCRKKYDTCMITGKTLIGLRPPGIWTCMRCSSRMFRRFSRERKTCPVCFLVTRR